MEHKSLEKIVCFPCFGCCKYGDCNLHQIGYEIFDRGEDASEGNHIIFEDGITTVKRDELKNNPSPRRHGITIKFYCEQDQEHKFYLDIWQHKGNTFSSWRMGD